MFFIKFQYPQILAFVFESLNVFCLKTEIFMVTLAALVPSSVSPSNPQGHSLVNIETY